MGSGTRLPKFPFAQGGDNPPERPPSHFSGQANEANGNIPLSGMFSEPGVAKSFVSAVGFFVDCPGDTDRPDCKETTHSARRRLKQKLERKRVIKLKSANCSRGFFEEFETAPLLVLLK